MSGMEKGHSEESYSEVKAKAQGKNKKISPNGGVLKASPGMWV